MKPILQNRRLYGLKSRFAVSLLLSGLICTILFCVLYIANDYLITSYFEEPAVKNKMMDNKAKELQKFIDDKNLSSKNAEDLKKWGKEQPLVLLELYDGNKLIYSSYSRTKDSDEEFAERESEPFKTDNIYNVKFSDKTLTAIIIMDISYKYYVLGTAVSFFFSIILFILLFIRSNRKMIRYICRLGEDVQIIEGGNLEYEVAVEGNDELSDLAMSMNRMRQSLQNQIVTEQKLHEANAKLISEMSHDLRTPLTSLMLYVEILRSHKYEGQAQMDEYLEKIAEKADRMKLLSDNLFEYAIENRSEDNSDSEDISESMKNEIMNMITELETEGFNVIDQTEWKPATIKTQKNMTGRICDNIISNIKKYAEKTAPVFIASDYYDEYCAFFFRNTIRDVPANTESYGIGLESISSMMEQMNGMCNAEKTGDSFEITLLFHRYL